MPEHESASPIEPALLVEDLRLSLQDLIPLLERAVSSGDVTDQYLVVAGASQLLRDAVEDDPLGVLRAASTLTRSTPDWIDSVTARGVEYASRGLRRCRELLPARHGLAAAADRLDRSVDALADAVVGTAPLDVRHSELRELLAQLAADGIGADAIRLPSCFRSFDQHPRDLQSLAGRVLARYPERTSFLVVGVRTSGSYLAPLLAAALRQASGNHAGWLTIRPTRPPSRTVRSNLRALARAGVRVVVIDDPPSSGESIHRVATYLGRLGFRSDGVTLALALLEDGSVPARLGRFDAVLLEWPDWDIHRRLAPPVVRSTLEELWGADVMLERLERLELPERPIARGHARAGFRAEVATQSGTVRQTLSLAAEGVGLGFFGRHVVAVSDALPGLVPDVVGFRDGVVVREWLPDGTRVLLDDETRVRRAVRYVTSRQAALPARRDAAVTMGGQQPAWEVASRLLALPYGIAGLAMRSAGLDAAVRTLLAAPTPSVVDGQTGARSWFEFEGETVKVDFAERSFSNLDLACYDAAYDVAGLALGTSTLELADVARSAYESETASHVTPERWLLYRLVHLWDLRRLDQLEPYAAEAAMARVWQEWARDRLLPVSLDHGRGRWCVLDVDGVLETSRLGAPALTPSAASGLAALDAHGYRIALATGRSIAELKDRCARYGIAGGVAEYGAVVYAHDSGVERVLLDDHEIAAVAACAERLAHEDGVLLADGCLGSVRAYRVASDGSRVRIDAGLVAATLDAAGGALEAHEGLAQVDFVARGVDKARGTAELLALFGAPGDVPAVAVGDATADLALLRWAERGFVPAHARRLAGGTVRATGHGFQRGFHDAVAEVIGHRPSRCATCRHEPLTEEGAVLVAALLAGLEGGRGRGIAVLPEILRRAWRQGRAQTS